MMSLARLLFAATFQFEAQSYRMKALSHSSTVANETSPSAFCLDKDIVGEECLALCEALTSSLQPREGAVSAFHYAWGHEDESSPHMPTAGSNPLPESLLGKFIRGFTLCCGFSWSKDTRQIMDQFLSHVWSFAECGWEHKEMGTQTTFAYMDVEHKDTPLGQVMRRKNVNFARACHRTGHDKRFWLTASRLYAHHVGQKSLDYMPWVILLNYVEDAIYETFLWKHEMPLLQDIVSSSSVRRRLVIFDFVNDCKASVVNSFSMKLYGLIEVFCLSESSYNVEPYDYEQAWFNKTAFSHFIDDKFKEKGPGWFFPEKVPKLGYEDHAKREMSSAVVGIPPRHGPLTCHKGFVVPPKSKFLEIQAALRKKNA